MFIYNSDKTMFIGSFTNQNSFNNTLGTQFIYSNSLIIEYYEPNNTGLKQQQSQLHIESLVHTFVELRFGPFSNTDSETGVTGADYCNINVSCPLGNGWENEIKSVAIILGLISNDNKYHGWCSGALINNTERDGKPYFLTANHCIDNAGAMSNAANWVFLFNYEASYCEDNGMWASSSLSNAIYGATVLARDGANSPNSDYLLLELNAQPSTLVSYNVVYAGWETNETATSYSPYTVGIHHPSGDVKKISKDNNPPISHNPANDATENCITNYRAGYHWQVHWNEGITEGGSSGSPLFNSDHRIIGQLHGGCSFCNTPHKPDTYGKFSKSYTLGNFARWLDPRGTGVSFVDRHTPYPDHCYNGVQDSNKGETGVDCGGVCPPCNNTSGVRIVPIITEGQIGVEFDISFDITCPSTSNGSAAEYSMVIIVINKTPFDNTDYSHPQGGYDYNSPKYYCNSKNFYINQYEPIHNTMSGTCVFSLPSSLFLEAGKYKGTVIVQLRSEGWINHKKDFEIDIAPKPNSVITVGACKDLDDTTVPWGAAPHIFSGENILTTDNIKLSHGHFYINYEVKDFNHLIYCNSIIPIIVKYHKYPISNLYGGVFFEENGYIFKPNKIYKIKFNFFKDTNLLEFALTNNLTDATTEKKYFTDRKEYIFNSEKNDKPSLSNQFYIGNISVANEACSELYNKDVSCDGSYSKQIKYNEVTIAFTPDDYYTQLWVCAKKLQTYYREPKDFNSLKITEECFPEYSFAGDLPYSPTWVNRCKGETTIIASNTISIRDMNYTTQECVTEKFISGNRIIIQPNTIIKPTQNQDYIHFYIDNNYVCSSSPQQAPPNPNNNSENEDENSNNITNSESSISIFPNPTTGIVNIIAENTKIENISVFDISGKVLENNSNFAGTTLDLSWLSNGVYFIKIQTPSEQTTHKVIIQK